MKQNTQSRQKPFIFLSSFFIGAITCYFYLYDFGLIVSHYVYELMHAKHFIIQKDGTINPITVFPVQDHTSHTDISESVNDIFNKLQQKKGYLTLFSPDDNTYEILLKLIEQEMEKISIAIFSFTDSVIVKALEQAIKRGVNVELITDKNCLLDRYGKIDDLYYAGALIYIYNPNYYNKKKPGIMHHKFIIFSKNYTAKGLVWTGSYNFTKAARYYNQENVIVLNRKGVVNRYAKQFERIKTRSDIYKPFLTPYQAPAKSLL
ncbi:MAG TPA: phospholipase D-like domain-containing protein [Patescibacteria group bacterium]|nr:phospholipase D-like domain-containing protein [Patescibacteria group bacterium]